jgi:hypothetical protein
MDSERSERGFSAEGAVVEILEREGTRFAKIVLEPGTVLEVPVPHGDVSLGDRVIVDASLHVERVRGGEELADATAPPEGTTSARDALAFGPREPLAFTDYEHVLRMAALFAVAIVCFLAWRSWMVPKDFGQYGHFRTGAIADAAKRTPAFGGQASCIECHDEVQKVRLTGRHAAIGCEACHGPLGRHARGETDVAPVRPSTRAVCLTCHTAKEGLPKAFPRIVVKDHSEAGPCTECHKPHAPGIS